MIKLSFFYSNTEGSKFDFNYYCTIHAALSHQRLVPALKGFSVEYGCADKTQISVYTCAALISTGRIK